MNDFELTVPDLYCECVSRLYDPPEEYNNDRCIENVTDKGLTHMLYINSHGWKAKEKVTSKVKWQRIAFGESIYFLKIISNN